MLYEIVTSVGPLNQLVDIEYFENINDKLSSIYKRLLLKRFTLIGEDGTEYEYDHDVIQYGNNKETILYEMIGLYGTKSLCRQNTISGRTMYKVKFKLNDKNELCDTFTSLDYAESVYFKYDVN